jgi:hypothetical protein
MNAAHTYVVGVEYPRQLEAKSILKLLGDAIVHVRSVTKRTLTFDSSRKKAEVERLLKAVADVYVEEPTGKVELL